MTSLEKKVYKIFLKVLKLKKVSDLSEKSSPRNINTWDSLAHIEIVTNLNKVFKIDIKFEDFLSGDDPDKRIWEPNSLSKINE